MAKSLGKTTQDIQENRPGNGITAGSAKEGFIAVQKHNEGIVVDNVPQTKNASNNIIVLPYCEFLSLLLLISINQSLLHCHLIDKKNGFQFINQSPKHVFHSAAMIAIIAYLILSYKIISNTDNKKTLSKVVSVFFLGALITSNVLFILKGLEILSLDYLPLFMLGCFLLLSVVYSVQEKLILKYGDFDDWNVRFSPEDYKFINESLDGLNSPKLVPEFIDDIKDWRDHWSSRDDRRAKKSNNNLKSSKTRDSSNSTDTDIISTEDSNRYQWEKSNNIATLQIYAGLLGLIVIGFELLYDKVFTDTTIQIFELEAPTWGHHTCLLFHLLTIGGIMLALFNESTFCLSKKAELYKWWDGKKNFITNFFKPKNITTPNEYKLSYTLILF